jgi:hypothetical protein
MTSDFSKTKFPRELASRIHEIAVKTGCSDDEVVAFLVGRFFELVDDPDETDVPGLVKKVRKALRNKSERPRN